MLRYYAYSRNNQAKKALKAATFNRFLLLGVDREQDCVAVFTDSIDETKTLLQYFPRMKPGTEVWILNPRLRGFIGDTNTALVSTSQPLIPITTHIPPNSLYPKPVTENENYSYFNFKTDSLQIANATYITNLCNSALCDGFGNKSDPCGCISASNRATGLKMELYCKEFEMDRVDVPIVDFASVTLGEVMMVEKFDVMALPSHDVDDAVRKIAEVQNQTGFRIIGWCRAAKETEHSISDAKIMHVVYCMPEGELCDDAKALRLKMASDDDNDNSDMLLKKLEKIASS